MHSIFEYFHLDWFSIRELRSLALQYNSTNPINKEQEWKMQADGGGERRKRDGQRERERDRRAANLVNLYIHPLNGARLFSGEWFFFLAFCLFSFFSFSFLLRRRRNCALRQVKVHNVVSARRKFQLSAATNNFMHISFVHMAVNFVIVCELPTREMPSTALLFFCFKIFPMNSSTLLLRFNQIELSSFTCFVFLFLLIFRRTQFPKWAQKNRVMEQMQFLCDRSIFSLQNIQKRKLWIEYISNMFPHSHRSWRSLLSYPIKYNTVSIPKHHVGVVII